MHNIKVPDPLDVGQDFIELLVVNILIMAGGLIPGLPDQLSDVLALMIDMVKVPAKLFGMTVRWLLQVTKQGQGGGIMWSRIVLGFTGQIHPLGLHNASLGQVCMFIPLVELAQVVSHHETL